MIQQRRQVIPSSFRFVTEERRGSFFPGLRRLLRLPVRDASVLLLVQFATGDLVKPKGYKDVLAHCYTRHEFAERIAEMGLRSSQVRRLIAEAENQERTGEGYRWKHQIVLELIRLESELLLKEASSGGKSAGEDFGLVERIG